MVTLSELPLNAVEVLLNQRMYLESSVAVEGLLFLCGFGDAAFFLTLPVKGYCCWGTVKNEMGVAVRDKEVKA
jgi:hypothetical protein